MSTDCRFSVLALFLLVFCPDVGLADLPPWREFRLSSARAWVLRGLRSRRAWIQVRVAPPLGHGSCGFSAMAWILQVLRPSGGPAGASPFARAWVVRGRPAVGSAGLAPGSGSCGVPVRAWFRRGLRSGFLRRTHARPKTIYLHYYLIK